eukprot:3297433-Pyramimonas_sp.AAC.1
MRDQTWASIPDGLVACTAPAAAADRIERQSVRMDGGAMAMDSTRRTAHSSAAAAVRIHGGGTALPYATRSPPADTTTIAHPVRLNSHRGPNFMDPSVYQQRSVRLASGGPGCHRTATSTCGTGRGSRRASKPRVRSRSKRAAGSDKTRRSHSSGGLGHPSGGSVTSQARRWSRVPRAAPQSWQRRSTKASAFGSFAIRTCGHCPPVAADKSCDRQHPVHCGTVWPGFPRPLRSSPIGRSTSRVSISVCSGAPASGPPAMREGSVEATLRVRHRSTDLRTAAATIAGDMRMKSTGSQLSS